MRKISFFLAVIMLISVFAVPAVAFDESAMYGDANGDGKVNAKDVTRIMKAMVAGETDELVFVNTDVNIDGKVNAKDVTKLMKSLVGVTTVRLGHDDILTVITPSTCKTYGTGVLTCKECNSEKEVELPLTEHVYTSKVTTQPTCVKTGVRTYTCSSCGKSYTEEIPASGHKMVNGKCTVCGYQEKAESKVVAKIHGTTGTVSLAPGTLVWLPATGEKFHNKNNCGRMNPDKAKKVTVEEAVKRGYEACDKCYN